MGRLLWIVIPVALIPSIGAVAWVATRAQTIEANTARVAAAELKHDHFAAGVDAKLDGLRETIVLLRIQLTQLSERQETIAKSLQSINQSIINRPFRDSYPDHEHTRPLGGP